MEAVEVPSCEDERTLLSEFRQHGWTLDPFSEHRARTAYCRCIDQVENRLVSQSKMLERFLTGLRGQLIVVLGSYYQILAVLSLYQEIDPPFFSS